MKYTTSIVIAFSLLMLTNPSFASGGDGSGGKAIGFVDVHKNVFLRQDIADVTVNSFDLKTGERIYFDDIRNLLIEKDRKTFEKKLERSVLERALEKAVGGDSGGG